MEKPTTCLLRDRAHCFNWQCLITMPIDDGTTSNLLTHYGQVSLDNTRILAMTYVNTNTRDAQDNDMFYYFLADLLTTNFCTNVLLYADIYTMAKVPVASTLCRSSGCNVVPSGVRRFEKVEVKKVSWNKDLRLLILQNFGLTTFNSLLQYVNRLGFEVCSVN